jgi:hypothetical protein
MRTSGFRLGSATLTAALATKLATTLAAALAATLVTPSLASAQRNTRRSAHHVAVPATPPRTSPPPSPGAASRTAQSCNAACGDYSLAVISALLPAESPGTATSGASDVVTLVIENRGTAPAPASFVAVAPRNRLASSRHSVIPPLAPGERTTVQLPVENGPDGTQCISITISPAPALTSVTPQVLASAQAMPSEPASQTAPDFLAQLHDWSVAPDLPYWPDLPMTPGFDLGDLATIADILPPSGIVGA